MRLQNRSFENLNLNSSEDEIQIEKQDAASTEIITSTSSPSNSIIPKTARDKFFKDI